MRMARSTGAISGLLITLLGVWGALVPFVGPYFNYSFAPNSSWHFTTDRLWLCVVPGAVAIVAGLLVFVAGTRLMGALGGWLAVLAGAWFAVGPAVSLTWQHGSGPIGHPLYGSTRQMLELVGYFYGLGALIVALGAFSIGRFASRPRIAEQEAIARAQETGTLTEAPAGAAARPGAAARADSHEAHQRRRRFRLGRKPQAAPDVTATGQQDPIAREPREKEPIER